MIVINNKVLAEKNDPLKVITQDEILVNDAILTSTECNGNNRVIVMTNKLNMPNKLYATTSDNRLVDEIIKPNSYLCTDINGRLLCK